jgi:hypothetical protein
MEIKIVLSLILTGISVGLGGFMLTGRSMGPPHEVQMRKSHPLLSM